MFPPLIDTPYYTCVLNHMLHHSICVSQNILAAYTFVRLQRSYQTELHSTVLHNKSEIIPSLKYSNYSVYMELCKNDPDNGISNLLHEGISIPTNKTDKDWI